jgi:hypothetical protein
VNQSFRTRQPKPEAELFQVNLRDTGDKAWSLPSDPC